MGRFHRAIAGLLPAALLGAGFIGLKLHAEPEYFPPEGDPAERPLDPAAWGSDHAGQSPPEYLTGDECLFCHRDVGPAWAENPHHRTIRPATPDDPAIGALASNDATAELASAVEYLLGDDHQVRYLQRSDEYGKLRMLTAAYNVADAEGGLTGAADPEWDHATFASRCAGCHTTAVDPATHAFSAISLDCYTCHGNVSLDHTKDTSLVHLSGVNRDAREVVSTCGNCHLRGGKSRSTELPYPNNFIAGDNLFRDFDVDWDEAEIASMHPGDRHIFQNTRDVVLRGLEEITCLSCHKIHAPSTEQHQDLPRTSLCSTCHLAGQPTPDFATGHATSAICGYGSAARGEKQEQPEE